MVDHAEDGPSLFEQSNQSAKEIAVADKSFGPINRVEHPLVLSIRLVVAMFFAQDTVVGKTLGDQLTHDLFSLAVGNRHG